MSEPLNKQKMWNPYLETLSEAELRQLQLKRFKDIVEYAFENSKFYNDLYKEKGFHPDQIQEYDDITNVPVISKQLLNDDMKKPGFYGESLSVGIADVCYFHQTSGTTQQPLYQPDTMADWYWWAECWAQLLWAQGVRSEDKVFFPFNYNLFIAFWGGHYGCEKIGSEIVSAGGLSTKERIHKILELEPTVLLTTPTYAFRMIEVAENELGIDLRKTSISKIICAGEPGALIPSTKEVLESSWNADVYDHVGATEIGAWGFECEDKPGGLHINESMFLLELMDLETNDIITEPGKIGKIVITSFHRKGRPCIRFDTHDLACFQEGNCSCGRNLRLLKGGVLGRCDHLLKVKGTFVTPAVIENIINQNNRLESEYQIIVGKESIDSLLIHVEVNPEVPEIDFDSIVQELQEEIHKKTQLRFDIELKKYGELERGMVKSKRLVDYRNCTTVR